MSFGKISRLLIANRGEIACRVIKTARKMGIETVALYSEADSDSLHAKLADRSYFVGPAAAQLSYLNMKNILKVAKDSSSQAIHPGYGFLSESVEFATACKDNNLIFIGPPPNAIRDMGIKNKSKEIMENAKVPIISGYHGEDQDDQRLKIEAEKIGYPIMIKAVRGGGGKGMRIAMTAQDFDEQLSAARREALKSFNDEKMLIEKYITRPRHVEVQVFGDSHGNYVYLWERDCSIQRRHQKVLEEAPAPGLKSETRKAIGEAAVRAAKAVDYVGAGTVEFVMDSEQNFYFMEMNTRLQVEHPVSEAITMTDLVEWQLRIANGEPLPIKDQSKIPFVGHAFEARIYAEDCSNPDMMLPAAGNLRFLRTPEGASNYQLGDVRVDSGVVQGDEISVYYDPMIAKLIVWAHDRETALYKLARALRKYHVAGLPTNIDFLKRLCDHKMVKEGNLDTGFISQYLNDLKPQEVVQHPDFLNISARSAVALTFLEMAGSLLRYHFRNDDNFTLLSSNLIQSFRINHLHTEICRFNIDSKPIEISIKCHRELGKYSIDLNGKEVDFKVQLLGCKDHKKELITEFDLKIESDGESSKIVIVKDCKKMTFYVWDEINDLHYDLIPKRPKFLLEKQKLSSGIVGDPTKGVSPMPGVVEKVLVKPGEDVKKNQQLITLIAMKMEYSVRAGKDGTIKTINVKEGDTVNKNDLLVSLIE